LLELRRTTGIPATLAEAGVPGDRLAELASMAERDPTAGSNPVPVDAAALERLYRRAMVGELSASTTA
jgi:alcohol dehydrogenase class IV